MFIGEGDYLRMVTTRSRTADSALALASMESALADRFPSVPGDVLHRLVQESYSELIPARVQNFLPILVMRAVQTKLKAGS